MLTAVLAGLPVLATVCNALCETASAPHSHSASTSMEHGSDASCHETSSPAGPSVATASLHDCGTHDAAVREAEAALKTNRSGAQLLAASAVSAVVQVTPPISHVVDSRPGQGPAGNTLGTRAPLVLRI